MREVQCRSARHLRPPVLAWTYSQGIPLGKEGHRSVAAASVVEILCIFRASGTSMIPCHELHFSPQPGVTLKQEAAILSAWRRSNKPTVTKTPVKRGMRHVYQLTQPETNLAILLNCKWFLARRHVSSFTCWPGRTTTHPRSNDAMPLTVNLCHKSLKKRLSKIALLFTCLVSGHTQMQNMILLWGGQISWKPTNLEPRLYTYTM